MDVAQRAHLGCTRRLAALSRDAGGPGSSPCRCAECHRRTRRAGAGQGSAVCRGQRLQSGIGRPDVAVLAGGSRAAPRSAGRTVQQAADDRAQSARPDGREQRLRDVRVSQVEVCQPGQVGGCPPARSRPPLQPARHGGRSCGGRGSVLGERQCREQSRSSAAGITECGPGRHVDCGRGMASRIREIAHDSGMPGQQAGLLVCPISIGRSGVREACRQVDTSRCRSAVATLAMLSVRGIPFVAKQCHALPSLGEGSGIPEEDPRERRQTVGEPADVCSERASLGPCRVCGHAGPRRRQGDS